jgi:hypothetical protein
MSYHLSSRLIWKERAFTDALRIRVTALAKILLILARFLFSSGCIHCLRHLTFFRLCLHTLTTSVRAPHKCVHVPFVLPPTLTRSLLHSNTPVYPAVLPHSRFTLTITRTPLNSTILISTTAINSPNCQVQAQRPLCLHQSSSQITQSRVIYRLSRRNCSRTSLPTWTTLPSLT